MKPSEGIPLQPYLSKLTKSEIHTVMTSGFATIAGTVMAAYISFGVSPSHLLSASVMSAPAALAASKLLLPEENKDDDKESGSGSARSTPQLTDEAIRLDLHGQREVNLLDAATQGAASAATFVLNITAIVIAFIAFVSFLNALVSFLGGLVGQHHITFEWILGNQLIKKVCHNRNRQSIDFQVMRSCLSPLSWGWSGASATSSVH